MGDEELIAILRHGQGEDWDCPIDVRIKAADTIDALQAENDRLRAALHDAAEALRDAGYPMVAETVEGKAHG